MKKSFLAILLAITLILSCGCHSATLEGYSLFRSTPLGFSMEYPSFWSAESNVDEGIAAFATPQEGYSDQYLDSVSVQRFEPDMEGENAFTEYVKGYAENLKSTIRNFKLVSEDATTLDGEEAYKIVYESTSEDGKNQVRFMQIFAEHENYYYSITYIAEFSSYSYFMTYVEKMISTFAFI